MRLKTPGVWVMGLAFQYRGSACSGCVGFLLDFWPEANVAKTPA